MARYAPPKRGRFGRFLLGYAAVMAVLLIVGGCVLWMFLERYEASLPTHLIEVYKSNEMQTGFENVVSAYAQTHATQLQDASEIRACLEQQLSADNLKLRKNPGSEPVTYTIRSGKQDVAILYTKETKVDFLSFGFKKFGIDRIEWQIPDQYSGTYTVTAPQDVTVRVGDSTLTPENCEVEQVPYVYSAVCDGFPPVMHNRYTFRFYGDPVVSAVPEDGMSVVTSVIGNDYQLTQTYDSLDFTEAENFAIRFVNEYVRFTSNAGSMYQVLKLVAPNTDFQQRIYGSKDGMSWVRGVTSSISDLRITDFVPYGDAVICDAYYNLTDTMGGVLPSSMRILMIYQNNSWLAYNIEMI